VVPEVSAPASAPPPSSRIFGQKVGGSKSIAPSALAPGTKGKEAMQFQEGSVVTRLVTGEFAVVVFQLENLQL